MRREIFGRRFFGLVNSDTHLLACFGPERGLAMMYDLVVCWIECCGE